MYPYTAFNDMEGFHNRHSKEKAGYKQYVQCNYMPRSIYVVPLI